MRITTLLTIMLLAASSYAQNINMNLFAQRTYTQDLSDVWGYVDTVGNEYAIVGVRNGVSIVDVTDSTNINEVFFLPGVSSTWRDIKTNGKYAYISTEGGGGVAIIDLSPLPGTITNTTTYSGNSYPFSAVHNLFVDENEVLYVFGSSYGNKGAIMLDVSGANAMAPVELGVFDDYYLHDGMARGDTLWGSAIYEGWLIAIDVSNKSSTTIMGNTTTPHAFTHNAWVSDDGNFVYTTDEKNGAFVAAYDVTDLGNIKEVDRYQSSPGQNVIPHNTHVLGDFLVTSYYKDGVTVVDATYPYNLIEVGNYDSSPQSGSGFAGCWGAYPWLPSGKVLVSDSQEGLFILNTNYEKACYLEGTVTDYSNSNPLSGVSVSILNTSVTATTNGIGFYATGLVDAGTYNVQFSKSGYITQTITNVSLQNGVLKVLDVELAPLAPFTLTGKVIEESNSNPIQNADVKFKNFDNEFTTTTDANGDFSIPSFLQGTYEVTAGKWLYVNNCFSNEFITSSYTITIPLDSGIYDDFTFDNNWVVSGTATQGDFVRDEPLGTTLNNTQLNPELDVQDDCSDFAYITGNTGTTSSDDDVDGGSSVITSPVIDLSTYNDPHVSFDRWFYNDGNDFFNFKIDNGSTTVTVLSVDSSDANLSEWEFEIFKISDFITPTATMEFIFETADVGADHIVEAGVDKFIVTDFGTPQAGFTSSSPVICVGDTVHFANSSVNAEEYNWTFAGGSPATDTVPNPSVVYNTAGTYNVTLESINIIGKDTLEVTSYVEVHDVPVPDFTVDEDTVYIENGAQVNFTDASTNATSWAWDFGDSNNSILQNPTHNYTSVGSYTVVLTAANSGCDAQTNKAVFVDQWPVGINKSDDRHVISIYPNPTKENFTIQVANAGNTHLNIKNVLGEQVLTVVLNRKKETVNIAALVQGMYFVEVVEKGKIIETRKLLKQ